MSKHRRRSGRCRDGPLTGMSHPQRSRDDGTKVATYLEDQLRFDLVGQDLCDRLVKGRDDFHGRLRLKATRVNEVIERVNERHADAGRCQ